VASDSMRYHRCPPDLPGWRPKNGREPFDKLRAGSGAPCTVHHLGGQRV
jgi:hypothetical protein